MCSFGKYVKKEYKKDKWRYGGSIPGPSACKADALPLSYIPYVMALCQNCSLCIIINFFNFEVTVQLTFVRFSR